MIFSPGTRLITRMSNMLLFKTQKYNTGFQVVSIRELMQIDVLETSEIGQYVDRRIIKKRFHYASNGLRSKPMNIWLLAIYLCKVCDLHLIDHCYPHLSSMG